MSWLESLLLGLLQGLTEYLPISSSGHLAIASSLFGIDGEQNMAFTVLVHVATVLSTLVILWKEIVWIFRDLFTKQSWKSYSGLNEGTRYAINIIISMIPVGIVGVFFKDNIEAIFGSGTTVVGWYIVRQLKRDGRASLIGCLSLILAGAIGNLIDSCFYGRIFSESFYETAVLFPPEGGYAPLLQGKVVDMFYFPLFEFDWPAWVPVVGGDHFLFFSAIFNVADAAITIGVFWLLIDIVFLAPKAAKAAKSEKNEE